MKAQWEEFKTLFCVLRNFLAITCRNELESTECYGGKHIAFKWDRSFPKHTYYWKGFLSKLILPLLVKLRVWPHVLPPVSLQHFQMKRPVSSSYSCSKAAIESSWLKIQWQVLVSLLLICNSESTSSVCVLLCGSNNQAVDITEWSGLEYKAYQLTLFSYREIFCLLK